MSSSAQAAPCRHYARGRCLYGAKCRFSHVAAAPPHSPATAEASDSAAAAAVAAHEAFISLEREVNSLRRGGAPRDVLLDAVAQLQAAKQRWRELGANRSRSRFASRPAGVNWLARD